MAKAEEYETSQHSRSEELTALDTAKKVLVEKTAGAADREYSFIQVSGKTRVGARATQAKDEVLNLIQEMIEKLEEEAAKEAAHKAFCDKEMSETKAKKEDKESEIEDLTTKIDKATAKIAKLTE